MLPYQSTIYTTDENFFSKFDESADLSTFNLLNTSKVYSYDVLLFINI